MKSFLLTKTRARNGSRCFIAVIASLLVLTYSAFSNTAVYADTAYWAYSVSVSSELGSKTAYYVTDNMQNTSVSNGKVVYCFNAEKHSPKAATSNSLVRYSRVVGDNDVYLRYVSKPLNSQSLEKDLLNVLYKGYPNNGTGIQEKYDLSDAAFRSLTQEAVWAVTDSIKKYDAVRTQNSDLNSRANEAYKELLETETSVLARDALDSEVTLEFFISSQCDFQNLVVLA